MISQDVFFSPIGTDMLTDFVSGFLARRALSKREQKQNNVLLFWDKAQRAKKVVNISLPIYSSWMQSVKKYYTEIWKSDMAFWMINE